MKVTDLENKTFAEILKIDDSRLEQFNGYDFDAFAQSLSGKTLCSVDIIYLQDKKLLPIEGKDLFKLIYNSFYESWYRNSHKTVSLIEDFCKGIKGDNHKVQVEKGKVKVDKKYQDDKSINMTGKISGTSALLPLFDDINNYDEQDYYLLVNFGEDEYLNFEAISTEDRAEFEMRYDKLLEEIQDLKEYINNMLAKQNKELSDDNKRQFIVVNIPKLIKYLNNN